MALTQIDVGEERFSLKQVRQKLGVSRSTVYREIRDRKLGYVWVRGRKFVAASQLSSYLAGNVRQAAGLR